MKRTTILVLKAVMLLSLLAAVVTTDLDAAKWREVKPIEVTVDARDSSVELVGYLYLPNEATYPDPPLVILLHEKSYSHVVWNDFCQELASKGFASFAMDLRGHGLSIFDLKKGRNRTANTFYVDELLKSPGDVRQLVDVLIQKHGGKFDSEKLALIGAALGANTGLMFAVDEPRVRYLAMISPGLELDGLCVAPALREYGSRPLHIATAKKDIYSAESCYLISDLSSRVLSIDIYDTYLHGSKLLNGVTELRNRLFSDLERYLH